MPLPVPGTGVSVGDPVIVTVPVPEDNMLFAIAVPIQVANLVLFEPLAPELESSASILLLITEGDTTILPGVMVPVPRKTGA